MTNKQKELITKLEELVDLKLAKKYEVDGKQIYHGNYKGAKLLVINDSKEFNYYVNDGIERYHYYTRFIKCRPRQYNVLEHAMNTIMNNKARDDFNAKKQQEREDRLNQILNDPETYKNDYFEELNNNYEELNRGSKTIINNYLESRRNGHSDLILSDINIMRDEDFRDLTNTLNEGSVKKIVLTENSTALMNYLDQFDGLGWKIQGMTKVDKKDYWDGYITTEAGIILENK